MLDAFIEYERKRNREPVPISGLNHNLIHMPIGTRLLRMDREATSWILWLATRDYLHGTYLQVWDDGHVERVTVRADEGDEVITVRPSNEEIEKWNTSGS